MSETQTISVTRRDAVGKGAARAARRAGSIPGIVYGLDAAPTPIAINEFALNRILSQGSFFSHLFNLDIAGEKMSVLARDLQVHPVTDRPMHVDFLRVSADTEITVEVPVVFLNEERCQGLRDGGVLNVVRHEVEVSCRPGAIPEQIEVDLSGFEMGDSIHISSVTLPDGVTPTITDRDFTIATIAAPAKSLEEEDEAAASAEVVDERDDDEDDKED